MINIWSTGWDPSVWPNADAFWPELFLGDSEVDFRGNDFGLIPFGAEDVSWFAPCTSNVAPHDSRVGGGFRVAARGRGRAGRFVNKVSCITIYHLIKNTNKQQPAFFQIGSPLYSAKSVRFRLGNLKPLSDIGGRQLKNLENLDKPADDMFEWTYTSPEFPMNQTNVLQKFELPEPILCIEGYLQIELLGRVQTQEMDGLYYLCVCYVRALGRSLSPAFNMDVLEPYGFKKLVLRYDPEYLVPLLECSSREDLIRLGQVEDDSRMFERLGLLQNVLLGFRGGEIDDEDD
ncbi:F-box protein [Striga hermonthica]|uniref:F-box protein n=1 Tax=Striga hermonthica TaxID=68872 RepID=A0A9N7MVU7_STRHE|nr:F-box protein [Striga hermonthica]